MILIIGIGNPETQYEKSRHNVGFMFLDYISKKLSAGDFTFEKKFNSGVTTIRVGKKEMVLAKPYTYVNKSGEAVKKIKTAYKVKPENIFVIHDDLDIEFGKIKLSFNKNSGGHRGIDSIIKYLKTKKFYRIRIGISSPILKRARMQKTVQLKSDKVGKFVLSKFSTSEVKGLNSIFKKVYEKIS